ncbi:MAG: hypothetical protein K6C99_02705 [Lachnospiraceae bacterium]|nr:hypothetical protein [Lachnospiraceae bacterium]
MKSELKRQTIKETRPVAQNSNWINILGLVTLLFLYLSVAFFSYGYDDEYANINYVEGADSLTALVQSTVYGDIHPPLSYIINYALFRMVGNWSVVRMIGAGICAFAIWSVWVHIWGNKSKGWKVYSFIPVCLNPTLLMWCTGLRWYTYMTILVCVVELLITFYRKKVPSCLFWGVLFFLYILMFYVESSATILIVVSFLLLAIDKKTIKSEWPYILVGGIIALLCVLPQIYIFVTVKYSMGKSGGEIYSLSRCILGAGQNILCGQGAFPVSPAGAILLIGNTLLCFSLLFNLKSILKEKKHIYFFLSYLIITLAGIGGKIRNYTPIAIRQGDLMADLTVGIKNRWIQRVGIGLVTIGTIWSVCNVVFHVDTNKGGWNTPYANIISYVSEKYDPEESVVWTHDPVIGWYLREKGFSTIGEKTGWKTEVDNISENGKTLVIVDTYKGSMPDAEYADLLNVLEQSEVKLNRSFGKDPYAWLKKKMDADYPEYYCEIYSLSP